MSPNQPSQRYAFPAVIFLVLLSATALAQVQPQAPSRPVPPGQRVLITVTDENGVAVPSALVFLRSSPTTQPLRCETDFAGHCPFSNLLPGSYRLIVQKPNFYVLAGETIQVGQTANVDVKLHHQQEIREIVNVVESPPGIDPQQTASSEQLTGLDVLNIPYPATHDYRNVLNFIPGVVQDTGGQPHVAGAETYQTLTLFDGFNVTQPANGMLQLRVSTDAIRAINVQDSRISAEQGKGSGGVLGIDTGMGDDHYLFAATNFFPSFQVKKGFAFNNVVPRVTFSGPIRKGRVWFFEGADGEYDNIIVPELPSNQDSDKFWRVGNIFKVQANLAPGNILTVSYLINRQHDEHLGLSIFTPPSTTPSETERGDFAMVKNQHYFSGGELLDFGFNFDRYGSDLRPQGSGLYITNSSVATGSFYLTSRTRSSRWQALANLSLPPQQWHGRHEMKVGVDLDRLTYHPFFQRTPIVYLIPGHRLVPGQTCLTVTPSPCSRYTVFQGPSQTVKHNAELSGYLQDRWSPVDRLLIEPGLRLDWDQIIRRPLFSPRIAATYVLDNSGNTKLSAGIGIFYDDTNLALISEPFTGQRLDYFFDLPAANCPSTSTPCHVLETFTVNQHALQAPRYWNWSLALERKLPAAVYLKVEYMERTSANGFVYNSISNAPFTGDFLLENTRHDDYDALQIIVRKAFRKTYLVTGSYTRSKAHSNQVLDFNVDNPIFSPQRPGPFPWDAPNRFLTTGIVPGKIPLLHDVDIEYSAEARTGFPFYVVNNQQQLVQSPGSRRFPTYFTLNVFLEKRFDLWGRHWALRGGFSNITGRRNPLYVNNNIDSPQFHTFGGLAHRAFTARIRLLGRN